MTPRQRASVRSRRWQAGSWSTSSAVPLPRRTRKPSPPQCLWSRRGCSPSLTGSPSCTATTGSTTCCSIPTAPASRWWTGRRSDSGFPAETSRISPRPAWIPTSGRRSSEDLVGQYHRRRYLVTASPDYDFDTCWRDYRLGVVQAPLLTGLGFAFAASTERGDEMMLTMLHRGCRAIRELGTLDLIRSYQAI